MKEPRLRYSCEHFSRLIFEEHYLSNPADGPVDVALEFEMEVEVRIEMEAEVEVEIRIEMEAEVEVEIWIEREAEVEIEMKC